MAEAHSHKAIHLDGRTLEGGGQLVRNALVLAALTSRPLTITNIRGNRSGGGGLKAQHIACVRWLQHATNAHAEGAKRGSRSLLFRPGRLENGVSPAFKKVSRPDGLGQMYEVRVDVETAGSTGLVLQAVLPYILFSKLPSQLPVQLVLSGGTNVSGSPSYEYISQVLLPMLHAIGLPQMTSTIFKRGWSQGGSSIGRFAIMIPSPKPSSLPAFSLPGPALGASRRQPAHLTATFLAPAHCHEHFRTIMSPLLHRYFSLPTAAISLICEDSQHDKRLYLLLVAEMTPSSPSQTPIFLASDKLYQSKLPASGGHMRATTEMAEYVAAKLDAEVRSGASADEYMRDQLVIFQALAQGSSEVFPGFASSDDGEKEDAEGEGDTATRHKTPKVSRQHDRSSLSRREAKTKANRHRLKPGRSVPLRRSIDTGEQYDDDDPFERERPPPSAVAPSTEEGGVASPPYGHNDDDDGDDPFSSPSLLNQNPHPKPRQTPSLALDPSSLTASTVHLSLSDPPHSADSALLTQQRQQDASTRLRPASLHTLTAEWVCAQFLPSGDVASEVR